MTHEAVTVSGLKRRVEQLSLRRPSEDRDMRRAQVVLTALLIGLVLAPAVSAVQKPAAKRVPVASAVSASASGAGHPVRPKAAVPSRRGGRRRPTASRPAPTHTPRAVPTARLLRPSATATDVVRSPAVSPSTTVAPAAPAPAPAPPLSARPTPDPSASSGQPGAAPTGISRRGSTLLLNGVPWKFTGVNAFTAATWYGTNWGCGAPVYDLDGMFAALRPGSVVRFWAFQALGWNNKDSTPHIDFTGIDRMVAAAEKAHQHLIVTLSDQAGNCDDGHWHDQAWYDGGYADPRSNDDGRGLGNLSYKDWVTAVVTRYRNSPAIGFWEPVNEPQAADCSGATGGGCYNAANLTCPAGAAQSLQHFFTAISGQIRALDPRHLISEGVGGGGQCGLAGDDYATVASSPGVDLLTYHDYDGDGNYYPLGLQGRLGQAAAVGKPLVVEEVGVDGGTASGCPPESQRAGEVTDKIDHAFAGGASGFLPWWWSQAPSACGDDFGPGDPILDSLRDAPTS